MRNLISKGRFFLRIKNRAAILALQQEIKNRRKRNLKIMSEKIVLIILISMNMMSYSVPAGQQNRPSQRESSDNKTSVAESSDNKSKNNAVPILVLNSQDEYQIAPNDVVDIKIEKAEELSGSYTIAKSGSFIMPFLGRILAQGKTGDDLAAQIADGLRGRYLVEPIVKVTVHQHQKTGKPYFIQGAVRSPGHFQILGRPTLLELITLAGGLADNHGSTAFVIRKVKQPPTGVLENASMINEGPKQAINPEDEVAKFELVKANINGLLKGNFDNNIVLEPGDNINIPPTDIFFVAGEVQAPGSFPLKEGTTLRQAISLAQGTSFKARAGDSIIYRENPTTGKREEIKIDVAAVMNGKKEDLLLRPNDVILIPNSRLKSISNALLTTFGYSATRIIRY
jgi:polysaccharide biosynthesis/export protein